MRYQPSFLQQYVYPAIALLFVMCTKDQVPQREKCTDVVTYASHAARIINATCNFSGCHDGASGVGNYSTYAGLESVLRSGQFFQEVFVTMDMPRGRSLSEANLDLLLCWMDNDFIEN